MKNENNKCNISKEYSKNILTSSKLKLVKTSCSRGFDKEENSLMIEE